MNAHSPSRRFREPAVRDATPLPQLVAEIEQSAAKVSDHHQKMGAY